MPKPLIVILAPIAMLVGFLGTLYREIGRAFKYAWLEAMVELESAKRAWRS